MQRVDDEVVAPEHSMLRQHIVEAAYLVDARHEDQNGGRVRLQLVVLEADALEEANNQVVRNEPIVEKIDRIRRTLRVLLFEADLGVLGRVGRIVLVLIADAELFGPVDLVLALEELVVTAPGIRRLLVDLPFSRLHGVFEEADVDWESTTWDLQGRAAAKVFGDLLRVHGGGHEDDLEVGALRQQPSQGQQQKVGLEIVSVELRGHGE